MFKCFMNNNHNAMNAAACASVSASACSCSANQSAENNAILRLLDSALAVSIFVIIDLAVIILNKIIIDLLPYYNCRPEVSRA